MEHSESRLRSEKKCDSGYVLKVTPMGSVEELGMGGTKRVKNNFQQLEE